MSDKPENGLKQELDRRKRINRIKSIIVSLVGIWMLASVILCATLFVKVIHLENNLNKVLQNMPQVEQVENEETKNSPDADTGKNVEYGKQDQTGNSCRGACIKKRQISRKKRLVRSGSERLEKCGAHKNNLFVKKNRKNQKAQECNGFLHQ